MQGVKRKEVIGDQTLYLGDCLEVMRAMPANSADSIVTDPPYGLSFMGKAWDKGVPGVEVWREALRVLKPGGHLLAFAGTRTQHRMATAIEDAGFEIRDMVSYLYSTNDTARQLIETLTPEQLKLLDATFGRDGMLGWGYGSGFPKSANVSKQLDKAAGAEPVPTGEFKRASIQRNGDGDAWKAGAFASHPEETKQVNITTPATPEAQQWDGWGTALKPALEPITVARKPLAKGNTVAANVLAHGTGALNVDGCRVGTSKRAPASPRKDNEGGSSYQMPSQNRGMSGFNTETGRWPANLIHDGSDEVVGLFPVTGASKAANRGLHHSGRHGGLADIGGNIKDDTDTVRGHDDNGGSAARFFYCAKASKKDRGADNAHPTVKPTDLMRYLVRLVTPPGGTALDPFMGSGSTGKACALEGFGFIGIDVDPGYVEIARARIAAAQREPTQEGFDL